MKFTRHDARTAIIANSSSTARLRSDQRNPAGVAWCVALKHGPRIMENFDRCSAVIKLLQFAFVLAFSIRGVAFAGKPNIVLICADDMGYGDAGCYGKTNLIPTPNIDRLANQGMRFTDGYVTCSVCGPSRYGLLTGAYQQRFGVQWNPDTSTELKKNGKAETLADNRIPATHRMINQTLSSAGYTTGLVGKSNMPCYPKTTFDETLSVMAFGGDYWPDEKGHYSGVDEPKALSGHKRILWGPERKGDEYLTDRLGRQSVEFIQRHKERPFFLYLAFNAVHSPMQAKKSHQPAVAHLKTEALRMYAAMLLSMDENVGKVLDALDANGLTENTIVAFVSDNGPTFAYNVRWPEDWPRELLGSAGPLRGYKGQNWEGGIRIPFILRWPGKLKAGSVFTSPVSTLDLYPTLCAAAGAKAPDETHLDGVDLLPFLNSEQAGSPHERLFWYADGRGAIRKGNWKLHVDATSRQLFNLSTDIGEKFDLLAKHPQVAADLFDDYQAFISGLPPVLNANMRK